MTFGSNIRDFDAFKASCWDWTPFNNCFVAADGRLTGIRISDIDGHVEREGHFLWIETTRRNGEITRGQEISIQHRVARGDAAIIVFGLPNRPESMHFYRPHSKAPLIKTPCAIEDIRQVVRNWFIWADASGGTRSFTLAANKTTERQTVNDWWNDT